MIFLLMHMYFQCIFYMFSVILSIDSVFDFVVDTHALVKFIDEDCPGIVPLKRLVQKENIEYNGSCDVRWSNGKLYRAFLICLGV